MRNRAVPVKTPGSKLVAQYLTKRVKGMKCAPTGKRLAGIPRLSTQKLGRLSKNNRTVSRAYGGVYCGAVVKERMRVSWTKRRGPSPRRRRRRPRRRRVKLGLFRSPGGAFQRQIPVSCGAGRDSAGPRRGTRSGAPSRKRA